jgi:hypothetical protein
VYFARHARRAAEEGGELHEHGRTLTAV